MRRYGWYAETLPELAMNLGTWLLFLGLGMAFGAGPQSTSTRAVMVIGVLLGVGGQILWALRPERGEVTG